VITTAITIFAPFVREYSWSGGLISGLNALISMFILISNYYKLESSVETFYHTANQYDKLETSMEFVSSKILFVHNVSEKNKIILERIQEIEKKVNEIKEWNNLFIPEEVRRMFPIICNINIFSFIKRMEANKRSLLVKFKDIKNEIRHILFLSSKKQNPFVTHTEPVETAMSPSQEERLQNRLVFLLEVKDKIKAELLHYRNTYGDIDELFTKEIKHAQQFNQCTWIDMACKRSAFKHVPISNPVIYRYLPFLLQN
jgi:hypothetical protein